MNGGCGEAGEFMQGCSVCLVCLFLGAEKCPFADTFAKFKTVKLIKFIRLHTEKGGILLECDLEHNSREQGTVNSEK